MIRMRHGNIAGEVYVFDDEAQISGCETQYWWDSSSETMIQYARKPTWDTIENQVTEYCSHAAVELAYKQWRAVHLENHLNTEGAYWKVRWRKEKAEQDEKNIPKEYDSILSSLKTCGTESFILRWKKLFPKGICSLEMVLMEQGIADNSHWEVPFGGQRLAKFLLQHTLPLKEKTTTQTIKTRAIEFEQSSYDIKCRRVIYIGTTSTPKVVVNCYFSFAPQIMDSDLVSRCIKIISAVLDIGDPKLTDAIFDEEFRILLQVSGTAEAIRSARNENLEFSYDGSDASNFVSAVINCISHSILNELRSSQASPTAINLGIPNITEIANVLLIGLHWPASQVLKFFEETFNPITANSLLGLAGGHDVLNKFLSSSVLGKHALRGLSISLASRYKDPSDWVRRNNSKNRGLLSSYLSKQQLDCINWDNSYASCDAWSEALALALESMEPDWLEDRKFCLDLTDSKSAVSDRAKEIFKRICEIHHIHG